MVGLRLAGDLVNGYGYVGLVVWARSILRESGYFVQGIPREDLSEHMEQARSADPGS